MTLRWNTTASEILWNTVETTTGLENHTTSKQNYICLKDISALKTFYNKLPYSIARTGSIVEEKPIRLDDDNTYISYNFDHNCRTFSSDPRTIFPNSLTDEERQILEYVIRDKITEDTTDTDITFHQPNEDNTIILSINHKGNHQIQEILIQTIELIRRSIGATCKYFTPISLENTQNIITNKTETKNIINTTYELYFTHSPLLRRSNTNYIRSNWIKLQYDKFKFDCPNCSHELQSNPYNFVCQNCKYVINSDIEDVSTNIPSTPTKTQIKTHLQTYLQQQKGTAINYHSQLQLLNDPENSNIQIYDNLPSELNIDPNIVWVNRTSDTSTPTSDNPTLIYLYNIKQRQFFKQSKNHTMGCDNCDETVSYIYLQGAYHTRKTGFKRVKLGLCKDCYDKITNQIITTIQKEVPEYIAKII